MLTTVIVKNADDRWFTVTSGADKAEPQRIIACTSRDNSGSKSSSRYFITLLLLEKLERVSMERNAKKNVIY